MSSCSILRRPIVRGIRLIVALTMPLLVFGCHGPYRRTPLSKGVLLDVVVSNSVMHIEKHQPTKVGNEYLVEYSFLLENVGKQQVAFPLKKAVTRADELELISYCAVQGRPRPDLIVRPGQRYRVDCRIQLSPELRFRLSHSDAQITLTVPLTHASGEGEFEFEYRLFKGDVA